jgi:hypothetical protein
MRNIYKEEEIFEDHLEDDAPPADGGAKGINKHRVEPCPFCGAAVSGAVAVEITPGAKPDFAVRCPGCDATGPWAVSQRLAVGLWNFGFANARPASGRLTRKQKKSRKTNL